MNDQHTISYVDLRAPIPEESLLHTVREMIDLGCNEYVIQRTREHLGYTRKRPAIHLSPRIDVTEDLDLERLLYMLTFKKGEIGLEEI